MAKSDEILLKANRLSAIKLVARSPFYWFVAIDGALGLGLLYWWLLSRTTTWANFYSMYWSVPLYFWPYAILTLVSMVLFGMALAVAVYSWQHSKLSSIKGQGGTALGAVFGALGAACPVCGAFLLSALGIAGGIAILPLEGLELKLLSAGFFGASLIFAAKKLSEKAVCEDCEVKPPEDPHGKKKDHASPYAYPMLLAVLFLLLLFAAPLWKQEQVAAKALFRRRPTHDLISGGDTRL